MRKLLRPVAVVAAGLITATMLQAPAQAAPVDDGVTWLAAQLDDNDVVYNDQYGVEDLGLTLDVGLAFEETDGQAAAVEAIRTAMKSRVDAYTRFDSPDIYANAVAKLMVFGQRTSGGNSKRFGGTNLLRRLEKRVKMRTRVEGRIADKTSYPDSANTIGQAFAAEALAAAGSSKADEVKRFLLQQQCGAGWFRLGFSGPRAANQGCRAKKDQPDTDATVFAVSGLRELPRAQKNRAVRQAIRGGLDWLERSQAADGGHGGGFATEDANANSTGLAASLLGEAGRCGSASAAAGWVAALQVDADQAGTGLEGQEGAIAYNADALTAGEVKGITVNSRDQWRRTSAQAVPGLRYVAGC